VISAMIRDRTAFGETKFSVDQRMEEAQRALRQFRDGVKNPGGTPGWMSDMFQKMGGSELTKNTEKMLYATIAALQKVRGAEEKNVETLLQERDAVATSIAQGKERISTLKLLRDNLESMTIEERAQFTRGEYEEYLEKRKGYYERLADAIRNAKTETTGFLAGSTSWNRWMREPNTPQGYLPYNLGYHSGMTPAAPEGQGAFAYKILDELSKGVRIWETVADFIKGRVTETDTTVGAGSF
jgi:hypothetical protein